MERYAGAPEISTPATINLPASRGGFPIPHKGLSGKCLRGPYSFSRAASLNPKQAPSLWADGPRTPVSNPLGRSCQVARQCSRAERVFLFLGLLNAATNPARLPVTEQSHRNSESV